MDDVDVRQVQWDEWDEVLFIDGRKLGTLIPGSRKQKQLSEEEIGRVAAVYREFRQEASPEAVPGFCAVASIEQVRDHRWALTPGRYVGAEEIEDDDEPFEERFPRLLARLEAQFAYGRKLEGRLIDRLKEVSRAL